MNEIKECTCNKDNCYECRRRKIDETALKIVEREIKYCTGMDFDVEAHAWRMAAQYRDQKVNELAWEFSN